jgi:Terminase RNaseH-like domain
MSKSGHRQKISLLKPCKNENQLDTWIRLYTLLKIPREPVCPGHSSPFEYIRRAYFEPTRDLIVWAPRGGGKTRLAALATLLDLLHKPGCAVRILGGSLEQSLRMWEHLLPDLERLQLGQQKGKKISLANGSGAAVLTQSQRAVRGLRVQKLRCDEVEMFDPAVWEAAQLVTRSSKRRSPAEGNVAGAVEAISTFHFPWGLMSRIIDAAPARDVPIVRWCILEVLEKCPPDRKCATCPLWEECRGIAKTKCDGFVSIDDAIAMKRRVSKETWEAEMLCLRPSVKGSVFPSFDVSLHVRDSDQWSSLYKGEKDSELSIALDFGFAAPFVCLWIRSFADGVTYVVDEYVQAGVTMGEHIAHIRSRGYGNVVKVACDPAGAGRNDQTAMSNVALLRQSGFTVRFRKSLIVEGVEMIRAALRSGNAEVKLFIHPRCKRLIKAMRGYHYPEGGGETPVKDGENDHLVDALRYFFVNRRGGEMGAARRY